MVPPAAGTMTVIVADAPFVVVLVLVRVLLAATDRAAPSFVPMVLYASVATMKFWILSKVLWCMRGGY